MLPGRLEMTQPVTKTNVERDSEMSQINNGIPDETLNEIKEAFLKRHERNYERYINDRPLHDEHSKAFGRHVRAARVSKGWTVEKLADATGLSKGNILALEAGVYASEDIKPAWVSLIADALEEDTNVFEQLLDRIPAISKEESGVMLSDGDHLKIKVEEGKVYLVWSSKNNDHEDSIVARLHIASCPDPKSEASDKETSYSGVLQKIFRFLPGNNRGTTETVSKDLPQLVSTFAHNTSSSCYWFPKRGEPEQVTFTFSR